MDIQLDKALADITRIRRRGEATACDLADAPLLEGWIGVGAFLAGQVHGHPLCADGSAHLTDMVIAADRHLAWIRTTVRFYRLGKPGVRLSFTPDRDRPPTSRRRAS